MTETIPEVQAWAALRLAESLYYCVCTFRGRNAAVFNAMTPAARYPWIALAQTILEAQV